MALTADGSLSTCCSTIQRQLIALNAPNTYNELRSYGLINALESQQNLAGIDSGVAAQLRDLWGKGTINDADATCKFKVWVNKPICGTATDGVTSLCGNTNTTGPIEDRVQLDVKIAKAKSVQGKIEPSDVACLCNGTIPDVLLKEINGAAKKILASVEADLVTTVQAAMGDYINGTASLTSPRQLNLFASTATRFEAQPVGWSPLMLEYAQMQINGGVIGVGGNAVFNYFNALQLAPSVAGEYRLPQGINLWYDPNVQALADGTFTNPLLTWAPGSLWIMRYLDNVNNGVNHINDGNVDRSVVDIFGHLFDLSIKRDASCDKLIWVLNFQYDLWNMPQSVFGTCLDTNQKQAYDIGCDIYECADITPA